MLASGSLSTIKLWRVADGQLLRTLENAENTLSVAFSRDGRKLFSGSHDTTIKVWDTETGEQLQRLKGHTGIVHSVKLISGGRELASVSYDGTVRFWDTQTGATLGVQWVKDKEPAAIKSLAVIGDGAQLAAGCADGTIRLLHHNRPATLIQDTLNRARFEAEHRPTIQQRHRAKCAALQKMIIQITGEMTVGACAMVIGYTLLGP